MLLKKIEMINYLNKRDKRIKFQKSDGKYTSLSAMRKAKQLLWKIRSDYLPLLQNATYCYSFVWTSGKSYENRKYYVVDIYDYITYARVIQNPAEIYSLPQAEDKISYTKLYNNINRIIKDFKKSCGES
jgi:hypothetical protein